jgi:hypothetical protein
VKYKKQLEAQKQSLAPLPLPLPSSTATEVYQAPSSTATGVYQAPSSSNSITIRDVMDENYNHAHSSHFQAYVYEESRTPFHDAALEKAGFTLVHSDQKSIVYKHYKGNIYWGIAGSDRLSDFLTGASLYVTETPKGNYEEYSNQITDIYEKIRKMYPVDRMYISAHSLGGAMAKELLRKYPDDRNLRVDGFNSAPARITRVDDRYYSFRSSHDPVSIFDDRDSLERNRHNTHVGLHASKSFTEYQNKADDSIFKQAGGYSKSVMQMMYTMIQASGEVDKAMKVVENFQSLGVFVPATMSGIAAIFAMMQKPLAQHMNNGMQNHPANELTSIMVHQPDDIHDHTEEHWKFEDQREIYSYNIEL